MASSSGASPVSSKAVETKMAGLEVCYRYDGKYKIGKTDFFWWL